MDVSIVLGGGVLMAIFSVVSFRLGRLNGIRVAAERVAKNMPLIVAMYQATQGSADFLNSLNSERPKDTLQ